MMPELFSQREHMIFATLQALKDCRFVVIGGYAVNAYTLPRFSVDCDIVIQDAEELKKIVRILDRAGYRQEITAEAMYSGGFCRYEKRIENRLSVSIDILRTNVTDRASGISFPAEWVFKHSKVRILRGKTIQEELKLRIIVIDALLVMKIISCRATDIRDVFMMLPHAENTEWIRTEILRHHSTESLSTIINKVQSPQFKDGLSGVYGQFDRKTFDKHAKALLALQQLLT